MADRGRAPGKRDRLAAAVIRLSGTTPQASPRPLAEQAIAEAVEGGAATGLETRIWATIALLATPGQLQAGLMLAEKITGGLGTRSDLGTAGDRWRLLLAYHAGRGGLTDLAARLLTPLTTSSDPARQDAARAMQRAVDGPGAGRSSTGWDH